MVFPCKKCGSRYRIDDKLFEAKALKFACRKCGQVHLLRAPAPGVEQVTAIEGPAPTSQRSAPAPRPGVVGSAPLARPTSATTALPAVPSRQTIEMSSALQAPPVPGTAPRGDDLWFAIRKGQRIGPFTAEGLGDQIRCGVLHERSFVWRPTMASWTRMNQVPDLADVLAAYHEWVSAQADRTVLAPNPAAAVVAHRPTELPPMPTDVSSPSAEIPREASATHALAPVGGMVDGLYQGISQPALDLRKAAEVQAEEPPLPAPRGLNVDSTHGHPAFDDVLFPGDGSQPVLVSERDWPRGPAADVGSLAWPADGAAEIARGEPPRTQTASHHANLQEFSLLIRLGKRSQRNTLIALGAIGGAVVLAIGAVIFFAVSEPEPARVAVAIDEPLVTAEMSYKRKSDPVARTEAPTAPPLETWMSKPATARGSGSAGTAVTAPQPTSVLNLKPPEPKLEKLGKIDPNARDEFRKYASLLDAGSQKQAEVAVDVKPKTLTEMPKNNLSKAGMDAFMNTKMRKFSECKAKMSHPTDMPIKVGLSFNVDGDGAIGDIVVDQSGARDEGLDGCIRRIVGGWHFPPPEEATMFKTTLLL